MIVTEIFNTKAIAAYMTEAQSNKIPFLGEAYFPNKKKMGIDLKWLKSHKGLGVALKPSNFDAIPTIRPRGQANMTKEEMLLFRESKIIKEHDLMELSRISDVNDPFLQPVIDSMPDFPAHDILNAIAIGIVSGLASTGANQVVKQAKK